VSFVFIMLKQLVLNSLSEFFQFIGKVRFVFRLLILISFLLRENLIFLYSKFKLVLNGDAETMSIVFLTPSAMNDFSFRFDTLFIVVRKKNNAITVNVLKIKRESFEKTIDKLALLFKEYFIFFCLRDVSIVYHNFIFSRIKCVRIIMYGFVSVCYSNYIKFNVVC